MGIRQRPGNPCLFARDHRISISKEKRTLGQSPTQSHRETTSRTCCESCSGPCTTSTKDVSQRLFRLGRSEGGIQSGDHLLLTRRVLEKYQSRIQDIGGGIPKDVRGTVQKRLGVFYFPDARLPLTRMLSPCSAGAILDSKMTQMATGWGNISIRPKIQGNKRVAHWRFIWSGMNL